MTTKFENVIERYLQLNEAEMPGAVPTGGPAGVPGGPAGIPGGAGDLGAGGDMGGSALPGMPGPGGEPGAGQAQPDASSMDNKSKKAADPIAYTEAMLKILVDPEEGISPEMFSDFLDTFGTGLSKIRDQEGFKKFYSSLYKNVTHVMEIKEKLKSVYEQLHGTLKDVVTSQREEPDNAGGGTEMGGPAGPGVR